MSRVLAASVVASLVSSVSASGYPSASLLQRAQAVILSSGVSDGVAAQVRMVEKIVKQLQAEHRQVTGPEADTLQLVDDTLKGTTLPNIQAAHDADVQLLASAVQTIQNCDNDLSETTEIVAAKSTLDSSRAALNKCRSEEAALLAFQQGEQQKRDNHVAAVSQGPGDALGCALPSPSKLDDTPDGMGDFFKASLSWYKTNEAKLNTLVDNNNKAIAAHQEKKAECDTDKQPDFEAKYCSWSALIVAKRNNYADCRTQTEGALDKSFDDVTVKSGHRKSDFKAVNRVRCLLKVLMLDASGDDVDAELNKCLDAVIETSQFDIAKPAYPATADAALAALGNLAGETNPLESVDCTA
jgi:hypothetical protein